MVAADTATGSNGEMMMNAMIWETTGGQWDVIVENAKDATMTRITCYATEAEAARVIADLGWNLLSVVRLG